MDFLHVLVFEDVGLKEKKGPSKLTVEYDTQNARLSNYIIDGEIIGHSNLFQKQTIIEAVMYYNKAQIPIYFKLDRSISGGAAYGEHDILYVYKMAGNYEFKTYVENPTQVAIKFENPKASSSYKYSAVIKITRGQCVYA